eukprot:3002549-Prymnesium_polylepis.1
MARTKQTARKPTAGQAPGVNVAQQKVNHGKMIVLPGYIVKRSKKTGKKYRVKEGSVSQGETFFSSEK